MNLITLRNGLLVTVIATACLGATAAEPNAPTAPNEVEPSATIAPAPTAPTAQPTAPPTAPTAPTVSETPQIIVPEVFRRDLKIPHFPSRDFEIGTFAGTYSTQNFGASPVMGLRLGYHISEDFFVEGVLAQTKVSDKLFRQVLPGGLFPHEAEKLRYYNFSAGYNLLPGEVYIGVKNAKRFSLYLIGGVGNTTLNQQRLATFNFGTGLRVLYNEHIALQFDARDHIFSLDLLGKRQSTQNLELTLGLTASF